MDACLMYDAFDGDFGDPGDKTFSNKMVTARAESPCFICGNPTKKGTRVRVQTDVYDGAIASYRFCSDCCAAMANVVETDNHEEMDRRYAIREEASHDDA